ncbi:V-type ATP synthase subunit I [Halioxenophilus aromaticivorans]|uniref:V-type ATP synthase subunit I n=1 Tax=Halioxenophilus aromaticivorans TaxID=1306992 RepID=A0AAV3U449_9ALTE
MSIVPLVKVTVAASSRDQSRVLKTLQHYGQCHLIADDKASSGASQTARDADGKLALKFLKGGAQQRRRLNHFAQFDFQQTVAAALAVKQQLRECEQQLEKVRQRIELVRPWGDFDFPPRQTIGHYRFWFYLLPMSKRRALTELTLPWQIVGRSNTKLYVVVISQHEPSPTLLPVTRQHLGAKPLSQLLQEQDTLEQKLDELYHQRYLLTRFIGLIEKHMIVADNRTFANYARSLCRVSGGFFTLQIWLPKKRVAEFETLAAHNRFAFTARTANAEDLPPTLLAPNKWFKSGALLAGVYQLPSYHAWDPSAHLYLFFSLFFAMILSDAGYALLLGGVLGCYWRRLEHSALGRDLRWLAAVMVITALAWGILVGSYFGVSPGNGWLSHLHLLDLDNYQIMMQLSVFIGVLHIVVANFSALKGEIAPRSKWLSKAGWSAMALGGFFWWLFAGLSHTVFANELWPVWCAQGLLALGFVAVGVGSVWRSLNDNQGWWRSLANGFLPLLNSSKLFGDTLSYMRLFALGLASASLAVTFNQLAMHNIHQGGLALAGGLLILLFGHSVNLLLAIMAGVVHGLRLNFIEFYNWGEPGEGYPFVPFSCRDLSYE